MTHARTRGEYSRRRPIKQTAKRLLLGPKHIAAWMHRRVSARTSPRVLLVAQSRLMEQYVTLVPDLVPEGADVQIYAPGRRRRKEVAARSQIRQARAWAPWEWWDLIVLAEHLPLVFPPTGNAVLMSHGLVRAGRAPRGSFFYDRDRVLLNGRPVYAAICDPSERTAAEGERFVPQVAGRIRVTGDLRVDRMCRLASEAPVNEVPHLLVMSTWGSDSLLESAGTGLLDELVRVHQSGSVVVTVTCHPNLLEPSTSLRDWPSLLREAARAGVRVVDPSEQWESVLATADVVLTDHTSLCATYAQLRRPIIPVACAARPPDPETFFAQLVDAVDPWDPASNNLEDTIQAVLVDGFPSELEPAVDGMVDFLGLSRERFRSVFDEVLEGPGRSGSSVRTSKEFRHGR